MPIMCTYIVGVRNNQLEHLKAVCGLPAQFPKVHLANFIHPLKRKIFLLLKKRENPALKKNAVVSKQAELQMPLEQNLKMN